MSKSTALRKALRSYGGPFLKPLEGSRGVLYFTWSQHRPGEAHHVVFDQRDGAVLAVVVTPLWEYIRMTAKAKLRMGTEVLRQAQNVAKSKEGEWALNDPEFVNSFPILSVFLLSWFDADGESRDVSTLKIFADDGRWKVSLSEPNVRASIFRTISSPGSAFSELEASLEKGDLDWRAWPSEGKGKRKG